PGRGGPGAGHLLHHPVAEDEAPGALAFPICKALCRSAMPPKGRNGPSALETPSRRRHGACNTTRAERSRDCCRNPPTGCFWLRSAFFPREPRRGACVLLLVDEDSNFRRALAISLRLEGVNVVECCDADSARSQLATAGVAAALVDLLLPGSHELL